jgi:RNA polymerase primary sigma factor
MTSTSIKYGEQFKVHCGPRSARRGEATSFACDPALGNQARDCTKESADERSHSGPRRAQVHALRQPARLLTPVEQHELAARIKAGDQVAREALIVANLRLVVNIARRYYSYGATLDDLIQEGCRGLIRAVERYNPETHNTRFSTYASYWIRNKIQRAIAANFSLIRVPDYMFRLNVRMHKVGGDPRTEDGAAPGDRESAVLDSRSEITHRQRQLLNHSMISRSSYYGIDDYGEETSLEESIADMHRPEHNLETAETLDELRKALDQLTPVEAWLIRRRFGLDDPHEDSPSAVSLEGKATMVAGSSRQWSYTRLGRALGISVCRVREVEQGALGKLHSCLRCGEL